MQAPPVLEEITKPNLNIPLFELMGRGGGIVNVNDKKLTGILRINISFRGFMDTVDMDTAGGG
mgnify:FL=1